MLANLYFVINKSMINLVTIFFSLITSFHFVLLFKITIHANLAIITTDVSILLAFPYTNFAISIFTSK